MLSFLLNAFVDGLITLGALGILLAVGRGAVNVYYRLTKGRFERLKSRRSGSQQRVQTFLKELKKARKDAREDNQELKSLKEEIEDEIRENRDTIGYCNHALEGAGDV